MHASSLRWEQYPLVAETMPARTWLTMQDDLGLAPGTIDAYGRGLQDYLHFLALLGVDPQMQLLADVVERVGRQLAALPCALACRGSIG